MALLGAIPLRLIRTMADSVNTGADSLSQEIPAWSVQSLAEARKGCMSIITSKTSLDEFDVLFQRLLAAWVAAKQTVTVLWARLLGLAG